jgi:YqaJ-like viral recombinase domain
MTIPEGTEEHARWLQRRVGKATASRIRDVVATIKSGGYGAGRARYRAELVAERQTGTPFETYQNAAMRWGTATQVQAEAAYSFYTNSEIMLVPDDGFIDHPQLAMCGASPDGFIGRFGMVEFKCPETHTHIATLRGASIDIEYLDQMQWGMACTGRKWCDWCSYDPRMREDRKLFIRRVLRDDKRIAELTSELALFLTEVAGEVEALEKLTPEYLLYGDRSIAA